MIELVFSRGGKVWVAQAPEDAKERVVGRSTEEELVGGARCHGTTRPSVEQVSGCVKGFGPKPSGHGCVEQKSTNTVVERTQGALGFPVLLASVWAREAKVCAVVSEEGANGSAVELTSIICL